METEYLNVIEVAEILKVSERTVRNLCSNRMLRHERLSERNIRIKKEWVTEYLNAITFEPINLNLKENEVIENER